MIGFTRVMTRAALVGAVMGAGTFGAAAQDCPDLTHIVSAGDTLFDIAGEYYDDQRQWSALYYSNQNILDGGKMFDIPAGTQIKVPCLPGVNRAEPTPLLQDDAQIRLITGGNYAPFTDQDWPGNGMAFELVNAALEASPNAVPYSIRWENDWSQHLFPLLDEKEYDMGFPWLRPDCAADRTNERCANFHFSEPLVELLILLFTTRDAPFAFDSDADILGKRLCRPEGYFTHDLDRADRKWLTEAQITLVQPADPDACFAMLMRGEVDAVTLNEFTGWTKVHELGLSQLVVAKDRPLSVESLHVLISKKHWRGTTHLYRFNAGLEALKKTKRYDQIVAKHLGEFWKRIN
jgi:polar amino acid transport system substrate-binding protein